MYKLYSLLFCSLFSIISHAEVTLDGTLGHTGTLSGPDYQIGMDLGKQVGSNLFHSFSHFNINNGESATFSGSPDIHNVIARVTGGNPSTLNGVLRSTLPNADVYFLNPYGILLGKEAQLDVRGGFHASTADTLRLGHDGEFNARYPSQSLLTVAAPRAFGFLTSAPATISAHDSKLAVPEGETLSFIGGDLQFRGSHPSRLDEKNNVVFDAELAARFGRINLVSIATPGDVTLDTDGVTISPTADWGNILALNANIITSGKGGGNIFMRAGHLVLSFSVAESKTLGDKNGGVVDIRSHSMDLHASKLSTSARATGTGGAILVNVEDTLKIWGVRPNQLGSAIFSRTHSNNGNAGNILIQTGELIIQEGGQIATSTEGPGQGGTIVIKVAGTTSLSGADALNYPSRITADSWSEKDNAGTSGTITLESANLILTAGGQISASTHGPGEGGALTIKTDALTISGVGVEPLPNPFPDSPPAVFAKSSGIYSQSFNIQGNAGTAGELSIAASTIEISDHGQIATDTAHAGGGNITLQVPQLLRIHNGEISTSVKGGQGNGGNILIRKPTFVVLDEARVTAKADEGQGGHIVIYADQFILSPLSLVSASSRAGIDGHVVINSPDNNMNGNLVLLQAKPLNMDNFESFCRWQAREDKSRFILIPLRNQLFFPEDWKVRLLLVSDQ